MRVLVIEDDTRLAERTAEYLREHDAAVEIAGDGDLGLSRAGSGEFDVVLLDLMLPGIDGLELCRRLRKSSGVPVIMVSARGEEIDRIVGLEIGADDYLPKPFSPRELLARIRAVLRRGTGTVTSEQAQLGTLNIDRNRRAVKVADKPCELTAYQFDLLWVLAGAAERVMTRAELHAAVRELRGEPVTEFDPAVDRSIDVHLSKVRQALAATDDSAKDLIRTVRGVGYVLEPAESP